MYKTIGFMRGKNTYVNNDEAVWNCYQQQKGEINHFKMYKDSNYFF